MGAIHIKKTDAAAMDAYMELSGAIITREAGRWIVSTPQDTMIFHDIRDLMKDINENLMIMHKLVLEGQIEPELWTEAWRK